MNIMERIKFLFIIITARGTTRTASCFLSNDEVLVIFNNKRYERDEYYN